MAHDHFHGHALVGQVPAVVVGAHADEGVGDFGFAEELAFGDGGHVDCGDGRGGGEGAVEEGFGAGGELGAFCLGGEGKRGVLVSLCCGCIDLVG